MLAPQVLKSQTPKGKVTSAANHRYSYQRPVLGFQMIYIFYFPPRYCKIMHTHRGNSLWEIRF